MTGEKKCSNELMELHGNFDVIITANSRLCVRLEGDDEAWHRRLLLLPFERKKPKERITNFAGKLLHNEGPGILNWMLRGAVAHQRELKETGDRAEDILENTLLFNQILEKFVREFPDQWLWIHRRWKTRPEGEPSLY